MKRILSLIPLLASCLLLGCSGGDDTTERNEVFQAVMITDVGGMGDKGFNDAGWMGCKDAQQRLADRGVQIETHIIQSREQTDYIENLRTAAERGDVVIALGFLIQDVVKEVAAYYPDTPFIFIDGAIEAPNVASFVFRAHEGGFLAGMLSVYVSETGTVASMPGMDIPPVEAFAAGYRAGVTWGNSKTGKNVQVLTTTIGSFTDPVKAKSIAQSLLHQNADILFQLAGLSGVGVIEAVREHPQRCFAIGVDIDQDDMAPGKVLTSVLKRMDKVVSDQIIDIYDQKFQAGVFNVGIKEGYIGLTDMQFTRNQIPEEAFISLEEATYLITEEKIRVPHTRAEAEAFTMNGE